MLPDRVSNPGPLTYESGALPIALRGPVEPMIEKNSQELTHFSPRSYPRYLVRKKDSIQ